MDVLTTENFDQSVKDGLVIIDFFAEWCGPCHTLSPVIEEVAQQFQENVKVYKVDVDQAPQVAAKFQIMSIPTIMFFKNGEVKNTIVGAQPKVRYMEAVEQLLAQ